MYLATNVRGAVNRPGALSESSSFRNCDDFCNNAGLYYVNRKSYKIRYCVATCVDSPTSRSRRAQNNRNNEVPQRFV